MEKLLRLLENDGSMSLEKLSAILGITTVEVAKMIDEYKEQKVILGNFALIDWDKTDREYVTALIELKVTPAKGQGFDKIAEMIYKFDEVKSLYLMSGGFDLAVFIEGRTLREVAMFVAERLSPLESVVATATHFVLKKYKDKGIAFDMTEKDERGYNAI